MLLKLKTLYRSVITQETNGKHYEAFSNYMSLLFNYHYHVVVKHFFLRQYFHVFISYFFCYFISLYTLREVGKYFHFHNSHDVFPIEFLFIIIKVLLIYPNYLHD